MKVFLRADLNVPLKEGVILDDFKLQAILPTLRELEQKHKAIIIGTHVGRPNGFDESLSTKPLAAWLWDHNFTNFEMLENLRFFPGEQTHDLAFAKELASLAEFYVNDAFATLHRNDTSVTLLPTLYPPEKRALGPLVHKELAALGKLLTPEQPFVLIAGGGKATDKLPLLLHLLDKVNTILLCPAISGQRQELEPLLREAKKRNVQIEFPVDSDPTGFTIGPQTAAKYRKLILQAKTVFFNGLPGMVAQPETLSGAQALFQAMADCPGYTVIGGGDTVAAARMSIDIRKLGYVSTGGGATLAYLAGEPLPGLAVFSNHSGLAR